VDEAPLLAFKDAVSCTRGDSSRLRRLIAEQPRFQEVHFYLAQLALAAQQLGTAGRPDVDAADVEYRAAYAWRDDWPSLTLAMGNLALTVEEFDRAFEFYDRTLSLEPEHPDALLGRVRALTYLDRAAEALSATERLLATGYRPGEARYWRALNEARLGQDAAAWDDVERASSLLVNAEVPKLAGTIAFDLRDLAVAQQKLELARSRNAADCEVQYYLQAVLAETRQWDRAAQVAGAAASCFDEDEAARVRELETLRTAAMPEDRRQRQVLRRQQELAANRRMRAAAWFNAAAAHFNLGRTDEARRYALKVVGDEQFRSRAEALLGRLSP
jgi:tetratricopeptide (TPR) repeat protein